jgi:GxxExxY protein
MADKNRKPLSLEINHASHEIVDAAYKIHTKFGPGLLEGIYEALMIHELNRRGLKVERQVPFRLEMDGLKIEAGLRLDLLVENEVVVELKAVDKLHPVHQAQILSYLKLTEKRLGLLINFNVPSLRDGVKRFVL